MTVQEGATLKCVIAWSPRRPLHDLLADGLAAFADAGDIQRLGDEACLVYSPAPADEIRDRLRRELEDGEALLVVEFEKWSGHGRGLDARQGRRRGAEAGLATAWLLARGH